MFRKGCLICVFFELPECTHSNTQAATHSYPPFLTELEKWEDGCENEGSRQLMKQKGHKHTQTRTQTTFIRHKGYPTLTLTLINLSCLLKRLLTHLMIFKSLKIEETTEFLKKAFLIGI